jgi:CRISPR-associated endonuclease/helicase Cas3
VQADLAGGSVPIAAFWGKLGQGGGAHWYHPLICHMIDVAAVAGEMWDSVLSGVARTAIVHGLGMKSEAAARSWVVFLAGAHDLGKACPAFELREEAKALWPLYADMGPRPAGLRPGDAPHGTVTALVLPALLTERFAIDPATARRLAQVTGGHHGLFPRQDVVDRLEDQPSAGRGPWRVARAALLAELATVLEPPKDASPTMVTNATSMELAGLISVADWIGSDEEQFPYAFKQLDAGLSLDSRRYLAEAERQAGEALAKHGWAGWSQPHEPQGFRALFPEIDEPRPLQEAVVALANLERPGIVVIESPMGEGKTEAALYLSDRWGVQPGPRGLYVALPTQATSNQMFGRVRRFLAGRYPSERVNLQLLHGHAALSAEFELLRREGARLFVPRDVDPEDASSGVAAAAWFAGSKRGILAAFGVGTIDQGLLAVLQTKHVFVRLFGLAQRVIVIDEVHAYDTYMTTLLERLLEWLGALGSPVVLLSATLPRARRERLLAAYGRGLGVEVEAGAAEPYPRISWLAGSRPGARVVSRSRYVSPSARSRSELSLRWLEGLSLEDEAGRLELGRRLAEALRDGGCAAVICNTVARAQKVYRTLSAFFPGEAEDGARELDLLHARFLFKDRDAREKRALVRFGKQDAVVDFGDGDQRPVRRPRRAVLVATQIIEQSLDLDFDLMVTDLAPADLVLQRAGRLHRHGRRRPAALVEPTLWVCAPEEEAGTPRFEAADSYVYDEHVLLRSWLVLRNRDTIAIPGDVEELVEAVYDDERDFSDLTPPLRERWTATRDGLLSAQRHDEEEANERRLNHPSADIALWQFTRDPRDEDAPELHPKLQAVTRLAEPSVQVVLLHGSPDRPSFEAHGKETINLARVPDARQVRSLLARSVTLSDRRVIHALLGTDPPRGWQRSPLLRHARLLLLGETGEALVNGWTVRLDRDVGVEIAAFSPDAPWFQNVIRLTL